MDTGVASGDRRSPFHQDHQVPVTIPRGLGQTQSICRSGANRQTDNLTKATRVYVRLLPLLQTPRLGRHPQQTFAPSPREAERTQGYVV